MTFTKKCWLLITMGLVYGTVVAEAQTSDGPWQEYGTDNGDCLLYTSDAADE